MKEDRKYACYRCGNTVESHCFEGTDVVDYVICPECQKLFWIMDEESKVYREAQAEGKDDN